MRFSLFVHMERVSDQQTQKQLYDEMIELCQIADRGGMHAVWTGEHHAMNFTCCRINTFKSRCTRFKLTINIKLKVCCHDIRLYANAGITSLIIRSNEAFLRSKLMPVSIQKEYSL